MEPKQFYENYVKSLYNVENKVNTKMSFGFLLACLFVHYLIAVDLPGVGSTPEQSFRERLHCGLSGKYGRWPKNILHQSAYRGTGSVGYSIH